MARHRPPPPGRRLSVRHQRHQCARRTGAGTAGDQSAEARPTPYGDLRVVELSGDPAGEALGKLLASMGADVIKVELPEGAPSRQIGPAAAGAPRGDLDASLNFCALCFLLAQLDQRGILRRA